MNTNISKLIRKEFVFTFRAWPVAIILGVTLFVQVLKMPLGIWYSVMPPLFWCFLFSLSGSIRGYGSQSRGMLMCPVTRSEYVTAKYIFTTVTTLLALLLYFLLDLCMVAVLNGIQHGELFADLTFEKMFIVYPVVTLIVISVESFTLCQSIAGRISYSFVAVLPIVTSATLPGILRPVFMDTPLNAFWNGTMHLGTQLVWTAVMLMLSALVCLYSYRWCLRRFDQVDL